MNTILLSGLSGSHPLGAMAAFGLLRILARELPFGTARLAWVFDGDWRAELHVEEEIDADRLIDYLIERQPQRSVSPWLTWHDDIKSNVPLFREQWESILERYRGIISGSTTDVVATDEFAEFMTSFGSEVVLAKSKPEVKPTAFHMTAGQQRFLKAAKDLADSLDPTKRASKRQTEPDRREELSVAYRTALLGPWTYEDSLHSLGWDPATEGLYALSDRSPSEAGPSSVRAAVWLAFESLPYFPATPKGKALHTTGFRVNGELFCWPIWDTPIGVDALRCLIGLPDLYEDQIDAAKLSTRGVRVLMRCPCVRDANGRGTFRNAVGVSM